MGVPVAEICRRAGFSLATYFNWKKKYDGLLASTPVRRSSASRMPRHRNARIAYEAYLPGSKAGAETKRVEGGRLLHRPHIALRIEQLRQAAIKKSHATVGTILKEIDDVIRRASLTP